MTKLIILSSLFGIAQDRICFGSLFKLFLSFLVTRVHVRMVFLCQLPVCFFYGSLICVLINAKDFIIIAFALCHFSPPFHVPRKNSRFGTSGSSSCFFIKPQTGGRLSPSPDLCYILYDFIPLCSLRQLHHRNYLCLLRRSYPVPGQPGQPAELPVPARKPLQTASERSPSVSLLQL